ncbi:hypothetical protein [Pelagibacterium limicola]|uniref:hypothetical protein n=1 Tax=Pelagibacterium limicola TaxID=2791022 RepID=UPI0018B004B8|nr:hypothetical protein [Pelagibacterium limicola]
MTDGAMSIEDIEGRLAAQRQLLQWLLARTVTSSEIYEDLLLHIDAGSVPLDHQEDPGAVPTAAFATFAATSIEMRALLEPLKSRFADGTESPKK